MTPILDHILDYILDYLDAKNPAHTARIRLSLANEDAAHLEKAASFFSRYRAYIGREGKTLEYGLDCYLKLVARMVHERMEFLRSGGYASSTFADVEKQIYLNPEVFEYHMHGLVFAQFFWPEQSARFRFFRKHIGQYLKAGGRYLEVGGGHALYILEAMSQAAPGGEFHLVDISPSSMELAKGITAEAPIDFRLMNILDYTSDVKFDFITVGEVIEHLEDPRVLLERVRHLLAPGGTAFISAPANSPTIDHIYWFKSADEIRTMLVDSGFTVLHEKVQYAENVTEERARKLKVAVMFASFVEPAAASV